MRGRWSDSHDLLAAVLAVSLAMFCVWMLLLLAVSGGGGGDGTAPAASQPTTPAVSPATWLLLLGP